MAAETAAVANNLSTARDTGILDLSNCKLVQIPPSIYIFIEKTKVTKCDLSNNELKSLPAKLFQKMPHIQELNLANNNLGNLLDEVSLLTELKKLNLTSNNLTEIPEGVYRLEALTELKLQDNHIEEIDLEQLRFMRSLQRLHLEENSLSDEAIEAVRQYEEEHEDVIITTE